MCATDAKGKRRDAPPAASRGTGVTWAASRRKLIVGIGAATLALLVLAAALWVTTGAGQNTKADQDTGTGIKIEPPEIDFGKVPQSKKVEQTLTVSNVGPNAVTIEGIAST